MGATHDATDAPAPRRPTRAFRTLGIGGSLGAGVLLAIFLACTLSIPWTFGFAPGASAPRYRETNLAAAKAPPWWSSGAGTSAEGANSAPPPRPWLGADALGRDTLARSLAGGVISLGVGAAAALISVVVGATYGMLSGYLGGRADALMMRIVDVLYGLPYILLVVLLSVAASALADARETRDVRRVLTQREAHVQQALADAPAPADPALPATLEADAAARFPMPPASRGVATRVATLIFAIGAVSWLTLARVVRAQTMSLRTQSFVEAARAAGASTPRILRRHILPNLAAPIAVYATLTIPQAILQESFLSFLGIGIPAPLPSWGNLVADGLREVNPVRSRWWLLLFPCLLLTGSLLALNAVGEALRERFDPRGRGQGRGRRA